MISDCKVDTFAVKVKTIQADETYGHDIVGHSDERVTVLYLHVDTEGPFIYILSNYGGCHQDGSLFFPVTLTQKLMAQSS
jgi:hypothetical protein